MASGSWEVGGCYERARWVGVVGLVVDDDDRVGHRRSWLRVGIRVRTGWCTGWRIRGRVD